MVFFDKVWDYALILQALRRTFRTGQEQDCHYYELTGNVGLEHMIDQNIKKKVSMSEYLKKVTKEELMKAL
jgi:SNF2 family DNA or RNA helicase